MGVFSGGCHCGAVRFEVEAEEPLSITECNCSICHRTGYLHLIVDAERFHLLTGESALTDYRFNTGTACHRFCRVCGIKSFYIPRSHPNGVSVNLRCLDTPPAGLNITSFDGRNWEQNIRQLHQKNA